jgi:hypothetical protein
VHPQIEDEMNDVYEQLYPSSSVDGTSVVIKVAEESKTISSVQKKDLFLWYGSTEGGKQLAEQAWTVVKMVRNLRKERETAHKSELQVTTLESGQSGGAAYSEGEGASMQIEEDDPFNEQAYAAYEEDDGTDDVDM